MDIVIHIDDAAIPRLSWEELVEVLDEEFKIERKNAIHVLKLARRRFGLEVGDGPGSKPRNEQV